MFIIIFENDASLKDKVEPFGVWQHSISRVSHLLLPHQAQVQQPKFFAYRVAENNFSAPFKIKEKEKD